MCARSNACHVHRWKRRKFFRFCSRPSITLSTFPQINRQSNSIHMRTATAHRRKEEEKHKRHANEWTSAMRHHIFNSFCYDLWTIPFLINHAHLLTHSCLPVGISLSHIGTVERRLKHIFAAWNSSSTILCPEFEQIKTADNRRMLTITISTEFCFLLALSISFSVDFVWN